MQLGISAMDSIAFVIAAGTLHAAGIAIGLVHRWPMGRLALWAAGAMVSLGGVVVSLAGNRMKKIQIAKSEIRKKMRNE